MQQSRLFFLQVAGSLAAATVTSLLVSSVAFWSASRTLEANRQIQVAQEFSKRLNSIIAKLREAEGGEYRYFLTEDETSLQAYSGALLDIDQDFQFLQEFTAKDPARQRQLKQLQKLVQQRLNQLKEGFELRQNQGIQATIPLLKQKRDNAVMIPLGDVVRDLDAEAIGSMSGLQLEKQPSSPNPFSHWEKGSKTSCVPLSVGEGFRVRADKGDMLPGNLGTAPATADRRYQRSTDQYCLC